MGNTIKDLEAHDTWKVMTRELLPEGANALPGTWALKVKRYPDGGFRKIKAWFCALEDMQVEGVHYFDKYAPVVSLATVQLLLVMSITQGWKTK